MIRLLAILAATTSLAACNRTPAAPATFEVTSLIEIGGQKVWTVRDVGTGCEFILTEHGMMPRNERSADGASVKQRCVLTGTETVSTAPPPVVTTTLPAAGTFSGGAAPAGTAGGAVASAQERAVQEALADVAAESGRGSAIPPPSGARGTPQRPVARPAPARPAAPDADPTDGVESQLR